MGIITKIEYCDSTSNAQMGCDGCELWNKQTNSGECYAGVMTASYAGRPGWPTRFYKPTLFVERIAESLRWPDLTGQERPGKPHLNGYPRIIFLDDMGDTFTESLPVDWLLPYVGGMAAAPHIYLFLTKRPHRMLKFFRDYGQVPANFWLGTSITSHLTLGRLHYMEALKERFPSARLWLSLEPLWSQVTIPHPAPYAWWVVGGASGLRPRPVHPEWVRSLQAEAAQAGLSFFFKQWGAWLPVAKPTSGISDRQRLIMDEAAVIRPIALPVESRRGFIATPSSAPEIELRPGEQLFENVGKHESGAWLDGRLWREMPALNVTEGPPIAPPPIQSALFSQETSHAA